MFSEKELKELVQAEIIERKQEGCIVPDYTERLNGANRMELKKIYGELNALEISPDFPYEEPVKLDDILSASTGCNYKKSPDRDRLFSRFYGAWLGRIIGCIIGKPLERSPFSSGNDNLDGWECIRLWQEGAGDNFPPTDYISGNSNAQKKEQLSVMCPDSQREFIKFAETDDDIRYLVLGLLINKKYGNNFNACDIADMWHKYLTKKMVYTAEYIAWKNSFLYFKNDDERIEYCHSHFNPYREWIGAQIRIDHYGYYNAGDPLSAAKSAYNDANLSHVKNGVYGAMFFAALIACAFTENSVMNCINTALSVIPKKSRLYSDIVFAIETAQSCENAETLYKALWERFRELSAVHTNNNAAVCVAAIIMGKSDFVRSVSLAIGAGWDTDCNGATVGSFMGAFLGEKGIPKYLSEPLNDTLYSSIKNFNPAGIKECAEMTYNLYMNK